MDFCSVIYVALETSFKSTVLFMDRLNDSFSISCSSPESNSGFCDLKLALASLSLFFCHEKERDRLGADACTLSSSLTPSLYGGLATDLNEGGLSLKSFKSWLDTRRVQ